MEDVSTQLEKTAVFDDDAELSNSSLKSGNEEKVNGSVGKASEVLLTSSAPQTIGNLTLAASITSARTSKFYDERDSLLTIEEDR